MKQINLNDLSLYLAEGSISREKISDELYFSKVYKHCTSNSKLKLINPEQGGSPKDYFEGGFGPKTASLAMGTCVHVATLEPEEFKLAPAIGRPTAKLGDVLDAIIKYRKRGQSIHNSIINACKEVDYYSNCIDSKINIILEKGLSYYLKASKYDKDTIILPDTDREKCLKSIKSLKNNKLIQSILHPTDAFGEPIDSFNEEAFFANYVVVYEDKACIIPFKLKIDNWTIDVENKILTLNDLKTTGKKVDWFMNSEYGSMSKYHYLRQFHCYAEILKRYCTKEFGFDDSWTFNANVCVVETFGDHNSKCFRITNEMMESARSEFETLMKMIGYYTINGYDEEVNYVNG